MTLPTLLSSGSYSATASDDPADLRTLLKEEANIRQRRINRFTQMALLGAARCIRQSPVALDTHCGVYLASGSGQISDSCEVLEQIIGRGEEPMPFTFLNVSSNMAGFMVAQSYGLQGRNCAINRNGMAFEAALEMALLDLQLGVVPQALVGSVEECGPSVELQRQRLGVAADTPLLEESHWLLLGKGGGWQVEVGKRYSEFFAMQDELAQLPQIKNYPAIIGPLVNEAQQRQLRQLLPHRSQDDEHGYSESCSIGHLILLLQQASAQGAIYLNGSDTNGYTLFVLGKAE